MAEPQQPATAAAQPARRQLRAGYLAVGVVLTSFGLRGEMKVEPLTPFPDRFRRGAVLWFAGEERRVEQSRWNERGVVVLKLSGIESPEQVAALRDEYLQLPESARPPLPDGEYYRDDLLGLAVRTRDGRELGVVADLLPTGANDVLLVRSDDGEQLVPMIDEVILSIDLAARLITIDPLPGLLGDTADEPEQRALPRRAEHMDTADAPAKHRRRAGRGRGPRSPGSLSAAVSPDASGRGPGEGETNAAGQSSDDLRSE